MALRIPADLRALLIDLDGTLVDTLPGLREAYRRFLAGHSRPASDAEFDTLNGPRLEEVVTRLKSTHGLDGTVAELLSGYLAHVDAARIGAVRPSLGAHELLTAGRDGGLRLSLVTSGTRDRVSPLVERLGWTDQFDAIVCGDDVVQGKPAPDLYQRAMAMLGVLGPQALAIEDSAHGVASALAAGAQVVRVGSAEFPDLTGIAHAIRVHCAAQSVR